MKKLVLHIGSEKTGTTSIQRFCSENRKSLLDFGILYPGAFSDSQCLAHFNLAAAVIQSQSKERVQFDFADGIDFDLEQELLYLRELSESSDHSLLLLSAEHFSSRLTDEHVAIFYDALTGLFPDYDFEVVLVLRRQDEMLTSAYSTSVKAGTKRKFSSLQDEAMNKSAYFDYRSMVERWALHFGDDSIRILTFDELRSHQGLVSEFFNRLGFGVECEESQYQANKSLSAVASLCGHFINSSFEREKARSLIFQVSEITRKFKGNLIPQAERAAIVQMYFEDNKYIAKKYLDRNYLFSSDAYVWRSDYAYLSQSEAFERLNFALLDSFGG